MMPKHNVNKLQSLEPPIGLTERLSPKALKYRFYYPEFQNRIDKEKKTKPES